MAHHRVLRLPVIRGVMAIGESLAIGFRALAISANYAAQEAKEAKELGEPEPEAEKELSRGALIFAFAIAIGFAIALFKVTPGLLTELLPISNGSYFVVVEGLIRVTIFVLYLTLLSFLPDLRRVFQYHAAEHEAINAYEEGRSWSRRVRRLADPSALRTASCLGDGDRRVRVRVLRAADVVLAVVTRILLLPRSPGWRTG